MSNPSINQSVGRGGKNQEADVITVQTLLKRTAQYPAERHLDPGKADGDCGSNTIRSIGIFQERFMSSPDKRVDPGGQTFAKLLKVSQLSYQCLPVPHTVAAKDLVKVLLPRQGDKYVFGAVVPKYHPDWVGPWDCAEFVAWGIYQITGRYVGCRSGNAPNGVEYMNSYTGWFGQDLPGCATEITGEEAAETPGAIALRIGRGQGQIGHIAVSRGGNQTIEAASSREGVRCKRLKGRTWTSFWKLDFLHYPNQCWIV
jgi:hypothetical protein